MNNTKEIIIHVGVPKAASTYLQRSIFPFLKDVYFFNIYQKYFAKEKENHPLHVLNKLIMRSSLEENPQAGCLENIDEIKNEILFFINSLKEPKILISSEVLFQKPFATKLLKEIFPDAKILLITREQINWLESYYNYLIKMGGYEEIEESLRGWAFNLNLLESYRHYAENFGKDNVLVLPYEKLKENENEFLSAFYDFAKIERYYPGDKKTVNKGYSALSLPVAKFLNRFLNNSQRRFLGTILEKYIDKYFSFIKKGIINKKQKNLIRIYYEKSNTKLAELTGINFKKYGYAVINRENFGNLGKINFQKNIDRLAKEHKDKKIIIYGAGRFFTYVAENYDLSGLNIIAVSDKKFAQGENQFYSGYKAVNPYKISSYKPDLVLLGLHQPDAVNSIQIYLKRLLGRDTEFDKLGKFSFIDNLRLL